MKSNGKAMLRSKQNNRFSKLLVLIAILLLAKHSFANFISSQINLNSYILAPKDIGKDAGVYFGNYFSLSTGIEDFYATTSAQFSDLSDARYHTYARQYQLDVNTLSYQPQKAFYSGWLGRDYLPTIGQNLFIDGVGLSINLKEYVEASVYAGYEVPNFYQESPFNFEMESSLYGGRILLRPGFNTQLLIDADKKIDSDSGHFGTQLDYRYKSNFQISAQGVYALENQEISELNARVQQTLFLDHQIAVIVGKEDYSPDTNQIYEKWVHEDYEYLKISTTLFFLKKFSVSAAWGLQSVGSDNGNVIDASISGWGTYLNYQTRINSKISDYQIVGGVESPLWHMLVLSAETGYNSFLLNENDQTNWNYYVQVSPKIVLARNLQLAAEYEFQTSPVYITDHRLAVSIKYNLFKGFGAK